MNKDIKIYKIARKVGYKEQLSEQKKTIINRAFSLGAATIATICSLIASASEENLTIKIIERIIALLSLGTGIISLKDIIISTKNKIMLQTKINSIDDETINKKI